MSECRETKQGINRAGRFGIGWALVIVLIVAALGAAWWGLSVLTSAPKGVGDAVVTKNSAANWTAAQARFEDLYAGIEAADRKIVLAAEQVAANPTDKTVQQTYTGLVSGCIDLVGDYNADARKYLAADFKAADLPARIDDVSSSTDCKE